jgi:urease accessory protein UreF
MRGVAVTLNSSSISLLSSAVRLAEVGQDKEAMLMVELAKEIQEAEDQVRKHSNDASVGLIVKLSTH